MPDYEKLYHRLFAAMADAAEALERGESVRALETLVSAQHAAEENVIAEEREG